MHFLSVFCEKVCLQRYACTITKSSSKEWKRADGKALAARFFRTLQTAAEGTVKFLEAQLVEIGCVPNRFIMLPINIAVLGCSGDISHFQTLPISSPQLLRKTKLWP
jgi:hypothetical protein